MPNSELTVRVVPDINTLVLGLLWSGAPRVVINAGRAKLITLYSSPPLIADLERVLNRTKFATRITLAGLTPATLVQEFVRLATIVPPAAIAPATR